MSDHINPFKPGTPQHDSFEAQFAPPPAPLQVNYARSPGVPQAQGSPYQVPKTYADQPDMPTYQPGYNPGMAVSPTLQHDLGGLGLDTSGLDAFKSEALRQGPSQFTNLAKQEQNYLAMEAKSQGAATAAGQTATARAQLAARGGLSSGAAERLAQGGANNYLNMTQDVNNTQAKNDMQLGMNDEQNRISMMGQLPGMQIAAGNYGMNMENMKMQGLQYDTNNQIQENNNLNNWNMGMADIAGQQWGATQTAAAQRNEGK